MTGWRARAYWGEVLSLLGFLAIMLGVVGYVVVMVWLCTAGVWLGGLMLFLLVVAFIFGLPYLSVRRM